MWNWFPLIKWKRSSTCILRVERAMWRMTWRRMVGGDWFMDRCNRRRMGRIRGWTRVWRGWTMVGRGWTRVVGRWTMLWRKFIHRAISLPMIKLLDRILVGVIILRKSSRKWMMVVRMKTLG